MRLPLLATLGLLIGCVTTAQPQIRLPYTAEAMSCQRECMMMYNSCSQNATMYNVTGNSWSALAAQIQCSNQSRSCLMTCPGACVQQPDSVACYDLMGRDMLAHE